MLESVRGFIGEIFGFQAAESDPRKKEYGNLNDIRSSYKQGGTQMRLDRSRLRRRRTPGSNNEGIGNKWKLLRTQDNKRVNKMRRTPRNVSGSGTFTNLLKSIKGVFSSEDQELTLMQRACSNTNAMLRTADGRNGKDPGSQGRRNLRDRIVSSDAFKKKLLEIKYDDRMLEELRCGRSISRSGSRKRNPSHSLQDDKVILLERQVKEADSKMKSLDRELQITQKKLKFAQEKNALLESLLDDANIDSEYVKSRRDIKNLQKENLKPEAELPPSPRRSINPLFTSSPMRRSPSIQDEQEKREDSAQNFYNRYPKIPETEVLVQAGDRASLSPIRIDYSKYSS